MGAAAPTHLEALEARPGADPQDQVGVVRAPSVLTLLLRLTVSDCRTHLRGGKPKRNPRIVKDVPPIAISAIDRNRGTSLKK